VDRQDLPGRIEYLRGIRQLTEDLVDTNEVGVDLAIRLVAHGAAKFRTLPVLDRQIARPLALEVLHPMAEAVMNTGHATTGALSLCVDAYRLAVIQWKMRRITAHDSAVILTTMADLLDGLGMSADARAVRRRAWMCAILSVPRERYLMDQPLGLRGPEFIEQIERRIRQSGDSLPPQPASELIFGTNVTRTNWLPGWITYDMWRDADEAGRDRLTNEIHQRLTGFLNDSVPLPDLDKILTEVSATPPVGPETEDALRREGQGLLGEVKRFVGLGPVAPSP
jgi:hypothetical protein